MTRPKARASLSQTLPPQTTVQDLLETCVDVLERMPVSSWEGERERVPQLVAAGRAGVASALFLFLALGALSLSNLPSRLLPHASRLRPTPPPHASRPSRPLQTLASASSYGSLESAVPGLRSRLVARQLESVDALVRALQEAL